MSRSTHYTVLVILGRYFFAGLTTQQCPCTE